jgi:hypothetical protein
MSRSRRKVPIFGNSCASSEKDDKRITSGIFRAKERIAIHSAALGDGDTIAPPVRRRDALNPWTMAKDGRHWAASWMSRNPKAMWK